MIARTHALGAALAVAPAVVLAFGCSGAADPPAAERTAEPSTIEELLERHATPNEGKGTWLGIGVTTATRAAMAEREAELLAAVAETPSVDALHDLGTVYTTVEEYERGAHFYVRALDVDPTQVESWYGLGVNRYQTGSYKAAELALARALELAPEHSGALAQLGQIRQREGDANRARELYARALAADAHNVVALYGAAELHEEAGELARARELFERLAEIEPEHPSPAFRLARVLRALGEEEEAAHWARVHERLTILDDMGIRGSGASEAQQRLALGAHFLDLGRLEEALGEYQAALQTELNTDVAVLGLLGFVDCSLRLGNEDEARAGLERLESLAPDHPLLPHFRERLKP